MALPHAVPGEKIHLAPLSQLGPDARTSALVKTASFEAVQLIMRAGTSIAPHSVPGHVMLHCLEGAVLIEANERIELRAGDWVYLDKSEDHGLAASEDSRLLLTILFATS